MPYVCGQTGVLKAEGEGGRGATPSKNAGPKTSVLRPVPAARGRYLLTRLCRRHGWPTAARFSRCSRLSYIADVVSRLWLIHRGSRFPPLAVESRVTFSSFFCSAVYYL